MSERPTFSERLALYEEWRAQNDVASERERALTFNAFTAGLLTVREGGQWKPLDLEADWTHGDRVLVFLPKTHETLVAEYEQDDQDEPGYGLWMIEGGAIDPDDGAIYTELPVPPPPALVKERTEGGS